MGYYKFYKYIYNFKFTNPVTNQNEYVNLRIIYSYYQKTKIDFKATFDLKPSDSITYNTVFVDEYRKWTINQQPINQPINQPIFENFIGIY